MASISNTENRLDLEVSINVAPNTRRGRFGFKLTNRAEEEINHENESYTL